ncbi:MAG: hypothetical protein AAF692_02625, partial [Pseudomonadota bacterium]
MLSEFYQNLTAFQIAIAKRFWHILLAYVVCWSLPYTYIDIEMPDANAAYLIMSVVGIGLNFALLLALMSRSGTLNSVAKTGVFSFV